MGNSGEEARGSDPGADVEDKEEPKDSPCSRSSAGWLMRIGDERR